MVLRFFFGVGLAPTPFSSPTELTHKRTEGRASVWGSGFTTNVAKSVKAGLREKEVRRTYIPRAERRPVVQKKRSGEQLLASN